MNQGNFEKALRELQTMAEKIKSQALKKPFPVMRKA